MAEVTLPAPGSERVERLKTYHLGWSGGCASAAMAPIPRERNNKEPPFPRERNNKEPKKEGGRKRTDHYWCYIFLVCCVLAIALVVWSWFHGEPKRLLHEMDYAGRLCGVDEGVSDKPFLYHCGLVGLAGAYPRKLNYEARTCVESCPNGTIDKIPCVLPATVEWSAPEAMTANSLTWTKTQQLDVTQTVTLMSSYPSEAYPGRYCVPLWQSNSSIREDLIAGPLAGGNKLKRVVGSLRKVWYIVLIAALFAILFGVIYLWALSRFAGFLMLISLMLASVIFFCLGCFLAIALFYNCDDLEGDYQMHNPIVRSITGGAAKALSFFLGLALIGQAVGLACTAYRGVKHEQIDYVVGMVHTALECVHSGHKLVLAAVFMSLGTLVVVFLLFAGLTIVSSVGYLDVTMSINEEKVTGLLKTFKWYEDWQIVFFLYCLVAVWICEVMINWWQYTVVYSVCLYYFAEKKNRGPTTVAQNEDAMTQAASGTPGTIQKVQIGGIYNTKGEHKGIVQDNKDGGKTLVVHLPVSGPNGRPWTEATDNHSKERDMPDFAVCKGLGDAIWYHLGSLAAGAIYGFLTRPLRIIVTGFRSVTGTNVQTGGDIDSDVAQPSLCNALWQVLARFLTMVDAFLGGYSVAAYNDVVLRSKNFGEAAQTSPDFIEAAGGAISLLYGAVHMYEVVGVILVSAISSSIALIIMNLPWFSDPGNEALYVPNPYEMTVVTIFVCSIVSYIFLSLVSIASDTLLYTFAWAREVYDKKDYEKYVPSSMKPMLQKDMKRSHEAIDLNKEVLQKRRNERWRLASDKLMTATMAAASNVGTSREASPLLSTSAAYAPVASHP